MVEKLTGDVQGPLAVTGELEIEGTVHGGVAVNGLLDLHGACVGPLQVASGGHADVQAVVQGDVRVGSAAKLRFRGIIAGVLAMQPDSDVLLAVGTILNGRRLEADGSFTPVEQVEVSISDDAAMMRLDPGGTWIPAQ